MTHLSLLLEEQLIRRSDFRIRYPPQTPSGSTICRNCPALPERAIAYYNILPSGKLLMVLEDKADGGGKPSGEP